MKLWNCSAVFAMLAFVLCACDRADTGRIEWPAMGTVAALQYRSASSAWIPAAGAELAMKVFSEIEKLLNAHDRDSEVWRLAKLADAECIAAASSPVRTCYEAAFGLSRSSHGAFNSRWRGNGTLDLGAIAKGFAVDRAAEELLADAVCDLLIDLGGNIKAVRGNWCAGVKDPHGPGFAAKVDLREGEALATSAAYFRGGHIRDGRTGETVSNGVSSVSVLCSSAMWADGLSTTLFVLGPEAGGRYLDEDFPALAGEMRIAALWVLDNGQQIRRDVDNRFKQVGRDVGF